MWKCNKNDVGPVQNIILFMIIATFLSGMIVVQAMAYGEKKASSTGQGSEGQMMNKKDSLNPHPDLGPEDVVRIQLEALANNNDPYSDAGIEITFRFASPSNKKMTGPLSRFIQMLYNPLYTPMLNHQSVTYGELDKEKDQARQSVILTTADNQRIGYLFTLTKQKGGPFDQCWMTDSVLRFEVEKI